MSLKQLVSDFHREEAGQDLLEYALVTAAVLAAVVAGTNNLANTLSSGMSTLNGKIQSAING
jgi:Flp pilus assembly pilin Flp